MDELVVGKMYYVSAVSLEEAYFNMSRYPRASLCKCTSLRGKFKIREGVYRYMKYWVAEKEAKMEKDLFSDEQLDRYIGMGTTALMSQVILPVLATELKRSRKELEEAKKDSVWQDAPEDATFASVHHCVTSGQPYTPDVAHFYYRTLPKTPKQELIDSFAEKNAWAMKCSGLNKELLEAFVKEYEETKK